MKKILFAFLGTIILLSGIRQSYAQENIIPVRTDVSGFDTWTDTDVAGTTYLQLLKATSSTVSPTMDFDNYTGEALNFKARTYGGTNEAENTITVAISTNNGVDWTILGTRVPATNTLTDMTEFDLSAYNGTEVQIKFYVEGTIDAIGAGIDAISITGFAPASATLDATPLTLSGFNYITGSGPSAEQSFSLSGTTLDGTDVTITPSTDYEISLTSGTSFQSTAITITAFDGTATNVYVRLIAGLSIADYNSELITISGGGASDISVTCNGSVSDIPSPVLTANPVILNGLNYFEGSGPSAEQSFTLSGTTLDGSDVTITPSTNYEISLNSGTGFQNTPVTITAFDGTDTEVYVRLTASLTLGDYNSELITISGGGASDISVECNGSVTDPSSTPCLAEDFSGFTAGSHASAATTDISASLDTYTATTGWTGFKIYSAGGEIKLGASGSNGYIITPTIDLSAGGSVNFDYSKYSTDVSVVQVFHAADGVNFVQIGSDLTPDVDFQTFSINITDGTALSKIKIGTDIKRAFLDNIEVFCGASTDPVLSVNPSILSGFAYVQGFGPSTEQSFTVSGANLNGSDVVITPSTNYEISLTSGTGFQSTPVTIAAYDGTDTQIYVRLIASLVTGDYNSELITVSGGGASDISVTCSGSVSNMPSPTLLAAPSELSGFTYIAGSGPSAEQSFILSGTDLNGSDVVITPSTNYEISLTSGTGFQSTPATISAYNGTDTQIFVRLIAGLVAGDYNSELITVSGGGASDVSVTCSGNVSEIPSPALVAIPASLSGLNYLFESGPSAEQTFTLSGTSLDGSDVIITPSTNYEISLTSGTGFQSTPVTIAAFNGTDTGVYVRLIAGLAISDYNSELITISGGGASDITVECNGSVLDPVTAPCLAEYFDNFTDGSHASPSFTDIATSLDTYTAIPGWTGYKIYSAGGEIKIGVSGDNGYIVTPTIDLTAGGTLSFDYAKWASDLSVIQVFHASDGVTFVQVGTDITPETGFQTASIDITDGTPLSKIKIGTDIKRAFIDNIEVTCGGIVPTPELSVSSAVLNDFNYITGSGPSAEQSFVLSGTILDGTDVTITPSTNYEISLTSGSGFQSTPITITAFDGTATPVYVRLIAGLAIADYNSELITISGGGASDITVTCNGSVSDIPGATLTADPASLNGFNYIYGSGPSAEQSFTLSGINLDGNDVIITPSTDYEISLTTGTGFQSTPVTISAFDGTNTTVYVRLIADLSAADYNSEVITISGGGASDVTVTCSGSVTEYVEPTLIADPASLSGFNYLSGNGPSPEQSFVLSGAGLDGSDVSITPSTNYEISLTSGTGFQSTPVTISAFDGTNTTVYVRLVTDLSVGDYNSEVITISGGGAGNVTVTCNGSVTDGSAYPCLEEDFSGFTTGTHEAPSTTDISETLDTYTMVTGWTGLKIYSAGGEIKLGTSSANGYIITPAIDLTQGASLNFDYAKWGTDASVIQIFHASDGVNFVQVGVDITPATEFQSYSLQINDGTELSKIKIATDVKRAFIDNISVYCGAYSPEAVLTANPTSLSGFTYVSGFGPSAEQSYVLSGEFLDGSDVTITPTADYEISLTTGTGFQSTPIVISAYNGTETTVFARLKSGLAVGNYDSEMIAISGGGAANINVSCSGIVTPFVNVEFTNSDENLMIYPNPVSDILNIKLSNTDSDEICWNITNITGQVVLSGKLTTGNTDIYEKIDISNFKPGMYILNLRDNQQNYIRKFNKN